MEVKVLDEFVAEYVGSSSQWMVRDIVVLDDSIRACIDVGGVFLHMFGSRV